MTTPLTASNLTKSILDLLKPDLKLNEIIKNVEGKLIIAGHECPENSPLFLVGLGKAASVEVEAALSIIERKIPDREIKKCIAYTKLGHSVQNSRILQWEGDHPLISLRNLQNTKEFRQELTNIGTEDTLIFFLSGGSSALLEDPIDDLSFEKLKFIHNQLLESGLGINSMNQIRKGLSDVKNGGLLKDIKTKHIYLLINSDVPNDDPSIVGSSPILYEKLDLKKINTYLQKYKLNVRESKKKDDTNVKFSIYQSANKLMSELAQIIKNEYGPEVVLGSIYDEQLENVEDHILENIPRTKNTVFISGGEITIELPKNHGIGGRNTHFVLSVACRTLGENIHIYSIGTDGTDGPTDIAGAYINNSKLSEENYSDMKIYLENFDSYNYFMKYGEIIRTGPTGSNVMDIRIIWRE
ncbi:MAG: DUF4147 domain-containing protein [Halobacteriovoraceae bacterium]|nr:DUF4147 domain-containing protein [Halobacteriovoraceae bacterium]